MREVEKERREARKIFLLPTCAVEKRFAGKDSFPKLSQRVVEDRFLHVAVSVGGVRTGNEETLVRSFLLRGRRKGPKVSDLPVLTVKDAFPSFLSPFLRVE